MIPRIAQRGASFKGAGQYYLHDKGQDTNERVAWTLTHNVPTDDPELAMKWMAYTAMNSDMLKQQAGVPMSGRKSMNKPVYSFSIAWQPEQNPEPNHMQELAFDALDLLGLKDHEAVMVAHQDTAHPHVHVITNLVHPQTGKTMRPQNDRLRFSTWAEEYEKSHGKIYCEERVINNEKRKQGQKTKHRETRIDQSLIIQNLYNQADSSKAFQAALLQEGLTLCKGDRRGFVLVDEQGKISSLSRQLKGQRAKDIKERLADLQDLPNGQTISDQRQVFDRDQYETDRQKAIVDGALEAEVNRREENQETTEPKKKEVTNRNIESLEKDQDFQNRLDKLKQKLEQKENSQSRKNFADELDAIREKEDKSQQTQFRKERELREHYKREEYAAKIAELRKALENSLEKGERQRLQSELNSLQNTLADIDNRMLEQGVSPNDPMTSFDQQTPATQPENKLGEKPSPDETKKKLRKDFYKKTLDDLNREGQQKDKDQDLDLEL
ncbi:MAG: relaxase/mobilization nuclease domain-containing protein [Cytophagales bacterium]|nr:relaxase/mobilization nuclease domain-containing protein [Cytophagales bacterium]